MIMSSTPTDLIYRLSQPPASLFWKHPIDVSVSFPFLFPPCLPSLYFPIHFLSSPSFSPLCSNLFFPVSSSLINVLCFCMKAVQLSNVTVSMVRFISLLTLKTGVWGFCFPSWHIKVNVSKEEL